MSWGSRGPQVYADSARLRYLTYLLGKIGIKCLNNTEPHYTSLGDAPICYGWDMATCHDHLRAYQFRVMERLRFGRC